MAWASNPGYPGVTPNSNGGLDTAGTFRAESFVVTVDGRYIVLDSNGHIIAMFGDGSANGVAKLNGGIGLFSHAAPGAATTGGAHTAGGTYTSTEQAMLEAVYTALQSIGLVT